MTLNKLFLYGYRSSKGGVIPFTEEHVPADPTKEQHTYKVYFMGAYRTLSWVTIATSAAEARNKFVRYKGRDEQIVKVVRMITK